MKHVFTPLLHLSSPFFSAHAENKDNKVKDQTPNPPTPSKSARLSVPGFWILQRVEKISLW